MPSDDLSNETLTCINDCGECAVVCEQTARHCLQMGGEHAGPEHQALMRDCAAICTLSVELMARSSTFAVQTCRLCAETCQACADGCERLANGDEAMQECAETCRACAASCERMAAAGV